MTNPFKYAELEQNPIKGGVQYIFKFDNGYGASVISHKYSYGGSEGKWEIAAVRFENGDWDIDYDTSVSADVIGWLDVDGVNDLLDQISTLDQPTIKEPK